MALAMIDLARRWPFGLSASNWWRFAIALVVVIVALHFADPVLSQAARQVPAPIIEMFAWLTEWGESGWILIPSLCFVLVTGGLALVIRKRTPRLALLQMTQVFGFIFVGVGLPGLVANLLKRAIGRARPELYDTVGPLGFQSILNDYAYQSFPSGHATTAMAMALVIGFLSPRLLPIALVFGLSIAVSRVFVGAHYPTDVLAGIVLGTLGAFAVRNVFAARRWLFEVRTDGRIGQRPLSAVQRLIAGR